MRAFKCPNPNLSPFWGAALKEVPRHVWPSNTAAPDRLFMNNVLTVQLFNEKSGMVRLSVKSHDGKGGLEWDLLQQIKNDVGYSKCQAIEIYPSSKDVVNVANMRHLWVLPTALDIGWFRQVYDVDRIEPFTVQREHTIALEQLDKFIKGGDWVSIAKNGPPSRDGQYMAVWYFIDSPKKRRQSVVTFDTCTGWVKATKFMIITHYHHLMELPHE